MERPSLGVTELRRDLREQLNLTEYQDRALRIVTPGGKVRAALVPAKFLDVLEHIQEVLGDDWQSKIRELLQEHEDGA